MTMLSVVMAVALMPMPSSGFSTLTAMRFRSKRA